MFSFPYFDYRLPCGAERKVKISQNVFRKERPKQYLITETSTATRTVEGYSTPVPGAYACILSTVPRPWWVLSGNRNTFGNRNTYPDLNPWNHPNSCIPV